MKAVQTTLVMLLCSVTALGLAAEAQTRRQAAVAIDRVKVPATDNVSLQRIAGGLRSPWSLAFLPNGTMLVVEKYDGMRIIDRRGKTGPMLKGLPQDAFRMEDSGYLDIALDPDFAQNQTIYLAFAEGTEAANRTAIWKARLTADRVADGRVIFRTNVAKKGSAHPGGRLLFLADKTLLLTVGDGFDYKEAAQDKKSHLGKILRLTRDGSIPADNPFVGNPAFAPEIWTLGHRNIQGLARDPKTGDIWADEHGPRGGDEVNLLRPGLNYGWPAVTYGIGYDSETISERTMAPGFEPSRFVWSPSIAPSGLAIMRGARYPNWDGKFFVGALRARVLVRLYLGSKTGYLVEEDRMFPGLKARIRDVRQGPDGFLYVLTDNETNGMLLRVVPTINK